MELSPLVSPASGVSHLANVAGLVRGVGARTLSTKLIGLRGSLYPSSQSSG